LGSLTIRDERITFFRNVGNQQPRYSAYNSQKNRQLDIALWKSQTSQGGIGHNVT